MCTIYFFSFDINLESKLEFKLDGIKVHIYFLFFWGQF